MSLMDDLLAADSALFVDADASFEVEDVSYLPKGGSARTISVQVFRKPPEAVPGAAQGNTPIVEVLVQRHATTGISTVNRGGDTITIADVRGGTARARVISEIISEDTGLFHLRLR